MNGLLGTNRETVAAMTRDIARSGFKRGAGFNVGQRPRELLCLQAHSGDRTPLLLLILAAPPPIKIARSGPNEVDAGVAAGLESLCGRVGMTAEDYEGLLASIPSCAAWITWSEIHTIVIRQKSALSGLPFSIAASPHRIAVGVAQAIKWHSGGLVSKPFEFDQPTQPTDRA